MPSMEEFRKLRIVLALKFFIEKKQKWSQTKHILNVALRIYHSV